MAVVADAVEIDASAVFGAISIGTGQRGKRRGHVNAIDFASNARSEGCLGRAIQAAVSSLDSVGGGEIEILAGTYYVTQAAVIYGVTNPVSIRVHPGATIYIDHSDEAGVVRFSNCERCVWIGGKIIALTQADNQKAIWLHDGFANEVRSVTIDYQYLDADADEANPSLGVYMNQETETTLSNVRVLPRKDVIGIRDYRGSGNMLDQPRITNGLNQETTDVYFTGRKFLYGIDIYDSSFGTIRNARAWGLGVPSDDELAVIRVYGSNLQPEDGHIIIDSPHMEFCAVQTYITIAGSQGWVTISNPNLGLANFAMGALGDAAIKVTRSTDQTSFSGSLQAANSGSTFTITGAWTDEVSVGDVVVISGMANAANNGTFYVASHTASSTSFTVSTFNGASVSLVNETSANGVIKYSRGSARVDIQGGKIHNVGRSRGTAEGLFSIAKGAVMAAAAQVNVTGGNTFAKASGNFTVLPAVGDWVRALNFTAGANSGNFKVTATPTSAQITVNGSLTNETGTGDELLIGAYPYEAAAIWVEYASSVKILGVSIEDQRHQWGIAIDPLTSRAVIVDGGVNLHKGADAGAVAPFRLATATLPDSGSGSGNYDNCEGIGIGSIWISNWGATPVPFSNGSVGTSLGASAATITTTNAPFFGGLLGTSATNYDPAGVGVATNALTTVRRLS